MKRIELYLKIGVGLFMLCSVGNMLSASDRIMAPPLKHETGVYIDPQSSDIYWPTSLPFYIRLATSPEDGAPSFLLQNISKANTSGLEKYLEKGIKLEMNGNQFIRWYNYVTRDTMILKFYADGTPPGCEITFSNASKFVSSAHTYYGNGLKCTVRSNDGISGVKEIYYSIDGLEFETYRDEFLCTKEKDYSVRYYAVDLVGNASAVEQVDLIVDLTPPSSKHTIEANFVGNVLSPNATIQLNSSDQLSGVKNIFYKFDDQQQNNPYLDKPITVDHLSDGEHILIYYAVDQVENPEPPISYAFYLDKTPPSVKISLDGDQFPSGSQLFASSRTYIVLEAEDNKIGVQRIEKKINSADFTTYDNKFQLPANTNDYKITCRSTDILGNISQVHVLTVHLDMTCPKTNYRFDGSNYQQRGINWINRGTQIALSATDDESGVKLIRYKLGNDPAMDYSVPFMVINEGKYDFSFWAIDQVNNQEQEQTLKIIVDNTPPEIAANFSGASIRSERTTGDEMLEVYPRNTSVFLGSTDASASSAGMWYSINGSTELKYEKPIIFEKDGVYKLFVRTRDRVDNETTKTLAFIIKD